MRAGRECASEGCRFCLCTVWMTMPVTKLMCVSEISSSVLGWLRGILPKHSCVSTGIFGSGARSGKGARLDVWF